MSENTTTAPLLTIDEVCRYARIGRRMYFRLQELQEGPVETRIGHKVFVRRDTLDVWLRSHEQPANASAPDTDSAISPDFNDPSTLRAALLAYEAELAAAEGKTAKRAEVT